MKIFLVFILFGIKVVSGQKSFIPDSTLNKKILLFNSISVVKYLGDQDKNFIEGEGLPRVVFTNKLFKSYIIIYGNPGSNRNSMAAFEIGNLNTLKEKYGRIKGDFFNEIKTESGICLGMIRKKIIKIKGTSFKKSKNKLFNIISYTIKNPKNKFLKRYNEPEYKAIYYFKNNILVKFYFGFTYN